MIFWSIKSKKIIPANEVSPQELPPAQNQSEKVENKADMGQQPLTGKAAPVLHVTEPTGNEENAGKDGELGVVLPDGSKEMDSAGGGGG